MRGAVSAALQALATSRFSRSITTRTPQAGCGPSVGRRASPHGRGGRSPRMGYASRRPNRSDRAAPWRSARQRRGGAPLGTPWRSALERRGRGPLAARGVTPRERAGSAAAEHGVREWRAASSPPYAIEFLPNSRNDRRAGTKIDELSFVSSDAEQSVGEEIARLRARARASRPSISRT